MRFNDKVNVLFVPVLAGGCWLTSAANAAEIGDGTLIHPTLPPQTIPRNPSHSTLQSGWDSANLLQSGQYTLGNSKRLDENGKPLYLLRAKDISIRTLLEGIAKQSGLHIMIGDDVPNTQAYILQATTMPRESIRINQGEISNAIELDGFTLKRLVEVLCDCSGLTYSHIGQDTFLVVPSKPSQVVLQESTYSVAPSLSPVIPPDWKRFHFNGETYYSIPLQAKDNTKDSTAISRQQATAGIIDRLKLNQQIPQSSQGAAQSLLAVPTSPVTR